MFSCFHVSYNNQGVPIKVSTYHGSATQVNSSFTQFLYLFLVVFELLLLLFVKFLLFVQRQALFVVSVLMAKPVFVVSVLTAKPVFVVSVGLRVSKIIQSLLIFCQSGK